MANIGIEFQIGDEETMARALVQIEPVKLVRAAELIDQVVAPDRSMLAEELRRFAHLLVSDG